MDPTFIDLLGHLAWRPPSVVREASLLPNAIDAFRESQFAQIGEVERRLEQWIAAGTAKRERFWRIVQGHRASSRSLGQLTGMIEALERNQAEDAKDLERLRKAFRRDEQRAGRISREAAAVLKEVDSRLLAVRRKELQERLDFALFLRACRAELDPDSRGGREFDGAAELLRYLESTVTQ